MRIFNRIVVFLIVFTSSAIAQQNVSIDIKPTISKSLKGHKDLDRSKYFNLAANVNEINKVVTDNTQFDYYFEDLQMTLGRKLGVVNGEVKWGNSVKEDASRPGYADLDYLKSKLSPSDNGLDALQSILGANQGLAAHENHNAYPSFMPKYIEDGSHDEFPSNNLAAAELSANILKYAYTDFQRPEFYELVNEPDWRYWGKQKFWDFHTECKKAVDALGLDTKVGGPCYSVSYYYKKEFGNLSHFTKFIDGTNFELDFYSFHTYDYMKWNRGEFEGSITSGLPLESVFDALASYTYNTYDKEFKYVGSEHGAYLSDDENRTAAYDYLESEYFPNGSGFEHEMKIRSIDNYIMVNGAIANTMVFMNHPHIVLKTVPFILLESSNWDPYYYSSLLVKEDFQKSSANWVESRLIDYYRFFDNIQGRRVHSTCEDTDIQYHTFVDGNKLICVLKNQSNTGGEIDFNIPDIGNTVVSTKLRRLYRKDDFTPEFEESAISSLKDISFVGQEAMVLFVEYENDIVENRVYDEEVYYSKDVASSFTGSKVFTVKVSDYDEVSAATLRIGLSRDAANSKTVKVKFNNEDLVVPVENCANRITTDYYATTKIINIPVDKLQKYNTITVSFPDGKSGGVGAVVIRASKETVLGTDELKANDNMGHIQVSPNPAISEIYIKHQSAGAFKLFSLDGQLLKTKESDVKETTLALNNLDSGIYVLQFQSISGKIESRKIILK